MLGQRLPNKLDSAFPSGTEACCLLKERMTLIGKVLHKLRESLIIRLLYLFSACSRYVKQHFPRAKDSEVVLRSAEQCPCYRHGKRCIWPSCSMKLPARPTCMKLPSLNSLMRLSRESISCKGCNALLRGCGQTCAASTVSRLCAPISASIHFIQAKATKVVCMSIKWRSHSGGGLSRAK